MTMHHDHIIFSQPTNDQPHNSALSLPRLGSLSRLPSTNTGSGGGFLRIVVILQMCGHNSIVAGKANFTLCDLKNVVR